MNKFFVYALFVTLFSAGTSWVRMFTGPSQPSSSSAGSTWSGGGWGGGGGFGGGGGHK